MYIVNHKAGSMLAGALLAALLAGPAQADTSLLTPAYEAQLATWLGQGSASFTQLFSKTPGATSEDFHAAVDGKGRTISVMEATNSSGQTWLVGGYNPLSWSSSNSFNMTYDQSKRTAFVFNLTAGTVFTQTPDYGGPDDYGLYQTFNSKQLGPTFGFGNDLLVPHDLTTGGSSALLSYCDQNCNTAFVSLLDNSGDTGVTYGRMQVFSVAAVPEPSSWAMLLAGGALGGLVLRRRRRAQA